MVSKESDLRRQIVRVGRLLYRNGLVVAADGNISARLDEERLLVTPSGAAKGSLEAAQLLIVDWTGRVLSGPEGARPTSELPMHLAAYERRPDISAVVHAHPPLTIALSIAGVSMATNLLPEVVYELGQIGLAPYALPSSDEGAAAIRELIVSHDALVLERHGSLTVGDTPLHAYRRQETLEQQARVLFNLRLLGVDNPLTPGQAARILALRDISDGA